MASASSSSSTITTKLDSADTKALVEALQTRLVEKGEWNRLLKQLRTGLEDSGWESGLNEYAREQATSRQGDIHLNEMVQLLQPHAKATIPSGLRQDLLKTLRKFVEDNIEE